jgi:DNA polymerase-1
LSKTSAVKELPPVTEWGIAAHGALLVTTATSLPAEIELVIDVENNIDQSCAGIGVAGSGDVIYFFSPETVKGWDLDIFKGRTLVGHNVKYDVQMLRKWGFNVHPDQIAWDTQLAEYVVDSTKHRYGLKEIAHQRFGFVYPTYKDIAGTGKKARSIGECDPSVVANYCGCDVLFTNRLYQDQLTTLSDSQVFYLQQIELPTLRCLLEMEERGVEIDADYIRSLDDGFTKKAVGISESIRHLSQSEINLNSPQQVKQLLMDKAGLNVKSTAFEELSKHGRIPLVKSLLQYREYAKLSSTYTKVISERSEGLSRFRLKTRFNQTVTQTGRLSSSEPNLQNVPTRSENGDLIRKGFVAKPGHVLIDADYSQIEPRLMAYFSQDPAFIDIFNGGNSIYNAVTDTLELIKHFKGDKDEAKRVAKIMWLALAYNAGAFKLSQAAGITRNEAEVFITKMKLAFQQFFYWRSRVIAKAEIEGGITTLCGRFIPIPQEMAHLGPNYMVQGSASEVMKLALQTTREFPGVLTVHDELIFEVPEQEAEAAAKAVSERMVKVVDLGVPLLVEVGIGRSWSDAKA